MKYVYKGPTFSFISMWDTVGLLDVEQYSYINSFFINTIRLTPSKQQRERSEAGTGITIIIQAHAVSFYLVRWVGVSSVIGQNKLTCDWSK